MKYIGNKLRLLPFINQVIKKERISGETFFDPFTGTTFVAQFYKKKGYKIITSDIMKYSYVMQYAYIKVNDYPPFNELLKNEIISDEKGADFQQNLLDIEAVRNSPTLLRNKIRLKKVIEYLNNLPGIKGFMCENYSPGGTKDKKYQRQFFTDYNAMKIDAIRTKLQEWFDAELITEAEFYILLASLINEADYVANMSGTYGAFLKIWRSVALNHLTLKPPEIILSNKTHEIYQEDANKLIRKIKCDILYIDPPYNTRQYASNFHILETIAEWDNPKIYGKTGLRPYENQISNYNKKGKCIIAFRDLISHAHAKYILVSYNDEGIIPKETMKEILDSKGETTFYQTPYRRFRTESDHEKRHYKRKDDLVTEFLYVVKTG